MKKFTLKASLLAVLASTALISTAVYAANNHQQDSHQASTHQEGSHYMKGQHMSGHGGMRHMFKGLDLSDGQKSEIKQLMKSQRAMSHENRPTDAERTEMKAQILSVITASNFDEAKAKKLIVAKQERGQHKMLGMMKVQNEAYQLLTPEQQDTFKLKFEQRHMKLDKTNKHH